jgi:5-formyltetrahydrofolate cyclo-ligase
LPISEGKRALRAEIIVARTRIDPDARRARSLAIAERVEQLPMFRDARAIAVYAPLGAEVDPTELARRALARGARVLFPRAVLGAERRLAFAPAYPDALVPGPLGALEPPPGAPETPPGEIDCVVVPGVAFSEDGLRLGRGGGYYDAALERMPRAARIGVAFDLQIVATLPREPHDAALDAVVSESRTLLFERHSR